MPLDIDETTTEAIDLADMIDWLHGQNLALDDSQEFAKAAPLLKCLSNNKHFLADLAVEELKKGYTDDESVFLYSAQVMMLYIPQADEANFAVRANFWPSIKDQQIRAAGPGPFFYHRPHDHNFNFLTIGHHGPGYWSNYYEYNHADVAGYPGEHVPSLKFIEKKALAQGSMMLYRASIDVHDQLPAEKMSISLNIIENSPRARLVPQYAFDLDKATIKKIVNLSLVPCVFSAAAQLGGDNGRDILQEIATGAVHPLTRFSAHKALASQLSETDAYCGKLEQALRDDDRLVSQWAKQHIDRHTRIVRLR